MQRHLSTLTALALAIASVAFHVGTAGAAEPAGSIYAKERADCDAGRTGQDRPTCLKEAAAAAQERQHQGLGNTGSMRQNATERCKALPPKDQADCRARIEGPTSANQEVTSSGSVQSGGVIRETKTTTIGPLPAPATAPAQSPPASAAAAPR